MIHCFLMRQPPPQHLDRVLHSSIPLDRRQMVRPPRIPHRILLLARLHGLVVCLQPSRHRSRTMELGQWVFGRIRRWGWLRLGQDDGFGSGGYCGCRRVEVQAGQQQDPLRVRESTRDLVESVLAVMSTRDGSWLLSVARSNGSQCIIEI
jgi:hypothetical protein